MKDRFQKNLSIYLVINCGIRQQHKYNYKLSRTLGIWHRTPYDELHQLAHRFRVFNLNFRAQGAVVQKPVSLILG